MGLFDSLKMNFANLGSVSKLTESSTKQETNKTNKTEKNVFEKNNESDAFVLSNKTDFLTEKIKEHKAEKDPLDKNDLKKLEQETKKEKNTSLLSSIKNIFFKVKMQVAIKKMLDKLKDMPKEEIETPAKYKIEGAPKEESKELPLHKTE